MGKVVQGHNLSHWFPLVLSFRNRNLDLQPMKPQIAHLHVPLRWSVAVVLALMLCGACNTPELAATSPPGHTAVVARCTAVLAPIAWSPDWRAMFGSRRRLIQIGLVALFVGILLLIKR